MTEYTAKDRMAEGQIYLQKYKIEMQVIAGLLFIILMIIAGPTFLPDSEGYATNVYTELASVLATIFVIDRLNERRLKQEKEENLINDLVRRVGSPVNEVALAALDEIRKRDLPLGENGILKGKNLAGANLENANLQGVDLSDCILTNANLRGINAPDASFANANIVGGKMNKARLYESNCSGAFMIFIDLTDAEIEYTDFQNARLGLATMLRTKAEHCNFTNANLHSANLQNSRLWLSNLTNVVLDSVDLRSASLRGVNFSGATLSDALFNYHTEFGSVKVDEERIDSILPDNTKVPQWTPEHSMRLSIEFGMSMVGGVD